MSVVDSFFDSDAKDVPFERNRSREAQTTDGISFARPAAAATPERIPNR